MSERNDQAIGYYRFVRPLLFGLPPELAHQLAIAALGLGAWPAPAAQDDPRLGVRVWGKSFRNPIGLAAGFDKDAKAWRGAAGLGFGFVEVGSITPKPQPGNPKPRLFRLPRDNAIINRMGFNSAGVRAAAGRLSGRRQDEVILGVNLGKNRNSVDDVADYALGARELAPFADYVVVNVSSPNTPGLRALQNPRALAELSAHSRAAITAAGASATLLLKIAPDLKPDDLGEIAAVLLSGAFDGLIIGNTTITRPAGLDPAMAGEAGGLSGRPLFELSTNVLREMYRLTKGRVPLVGVGGIFSGWDAYAKIRAGASLVQLYTALVYRGPGLLAEIKGQLLLALENDGFASLAEAVGADHRAS